MSDKTASQRSDKWDPDMSEGPVLENGSDETLCNIYRQIRNMPEPQPPADFVASVMKSIHPIKRPWWYRLKKWARSPVTITPLQLVPTAGVLVTACLILAITMGPGEDQGDSRGTGHQKSATAVTLTLNRPGAKSVAVVGSFNGWHGESCAMHRHESAWTITLHIPKGRYEYAFLVDGEEIVPDPQARIYQEDGFGQKNAVLIVENPDEKSI